MTTSPARITPGLVCSFDNLTSCVRLKPSWCLVAADDRTIPPAATHHGEARGAKAVESAGRHAIYVSRPEEVAAIIKTAAAQPQNAEAIAEV